MRTLLIEYDLNKPGQDYQLLIAKIKTYQWCHHLKSAWFIRAAMTPTQMREQLVSYIDAGDDLMIIDVTQDMAAWSGMSVDVSAWVKQALEAAA